MVTATEAHDPIEITGDAEFAALAADEGWLGSGTPSDPYAITDMQISTTESYAISLTDTTVSFVVSGCTLTASLASVNMQNVRNGLVDGNELLGAPYGAVLWSSDGNVVSNNTCDTSGASVLLVDSDDCILADNALSSSSGVGIQMMEAVNTTLRANAMTGCGIIMQLWLIEHATSHNISTDNTVDGMPVYYLSGEDGGSIPGDAGQVILADCSNMTVEGLALPCAAVGIMLYFSSNVTVADVVSEGNFWCGINAEYCNGVLIEGCSLSDNHNNGLRLGSCEGTEVRGCNVSWNHMGLIVDYCTDTLLAENLCEGNDYGLFMTGSVNTTLTSNVFTDGDIMIQGSVLAEWNSHSIDTGNTVNGKPVVYVKDQVGGTVPDDTGELILANCSDLEVVGHTFDTGLQTAVLMGVCENVTFSECAFENNSIGIYIQWSSANDVTDCVFLHSGLGIYAQGCTHSTFSNNSFTEGATGIDIDYDSNYNEVFLNGFWNQSGYAIRAERQSTGNVIHNNTFYGNNGASATYNEYHVQCYDDCEGNAWSADGYGNFWSDWTSPDDDADGIVDYQYALDPVGYSYDEFPLVAPPSVVPDDEPDEVKMVMNMERTAFMAGQTVGFEVGIFNEGAAAVELVSGTSQLFDFVVEDSEGVVVYDYSPTVLMAVTMVTLEPGENYSEELTWDPEDGETVVLGDFTITASLLAWEVDCLGAEAAILIDGDAPVTDATVGGEEGEGGWHVSEVTVSLDATDGSSGVGLTEYAVDGSEWSAYAGSFEVSGDGVHAIEYRSADVAGNLESISSTTVKVDRTVPELTVSLVDGSEFDTDSILVELGYSDACSGVATVEYTLDGVSTGVADGAENIYLSSLCDGVHQLSVSVVDEAGNEAVQTTTFEISIASDDAEEPVTQPESLWTFPVAAAIAAAAVVAIIAVYVLLRTRP
jgi:parallel beta-helix repeat protein